MAELSTPTQPKRVPWNLSSQASSLEAEPLEKYLDLIRDGSPESLSVATMIHPDARKDASDVRDCRQALRLIAEAQKPEPRRKIGKLEDKLKVLRDEIERLQELETAIETEFAQAERDTPNPHQFRRRIAIISANSIVRLALADELKQAGV